jgi:hypothetical protein
VIWAHFYFKILGVHINIYYIDRLKYVMWINSISCIRSQLSTKMTTKIKYALGHHDVYVKG